MAPLAAAAAIPELLAGAGIEAGAAAGAGAAEAGAVGAGEAAGAGSGVTTAQAGGMSGMMKNLSGGQFGGIGDMLSQANPMQQANKTISRAEDTWSRAASDQSYTDPGYTS